FNLPRLYSTAAELRFSQREFMHAQALALKSDRMMQSLNFEDLHPWRIRNASNVIMAMWAQKKWSDGLAELRRLDALAGTDERLTRRLALPMERGLIYLSNDKAADAVAPFERAAA